MTGHLWILGDSFSDPTVYPWTPRQGWPQLLAGRLGLGVVNSAESGAGYIHAGGHPFPQQAARGTGHGAAAVLILGSVNDDNHPTGDVSAAAAYTWELLGRLCPGAPIIVAGPHGGPAGTAPQRLANIANVRATAADAGLLFVDTVPCFAGRPELLYEDTIHPNPAGQATLADRLAPEVLFALAARTPPARDSWGDEGGWVAPWHPEDTAVTSTGPLLPSPV